MSVYLPTWRGRRCLVWFFLKPFLFWHLQLNDLQMTAGPLMSACPHLQSDNQSERELGKLEGAGMCQAPPGIWMLWYCQAVQQECSLAGACSAAQELCVSCYVCPNMGVMLCFGEG